MKLLVNISSIGARPTGLGVYALRCARAVSGALQAEIVAASGVSGLEDVVLRAPASCALGAGRGAALRRWVWSKRQRHPPERLVYSPTHHGFGRHSRQVLTIHDLIPLRFPRQHPTQHLYFRFGLPAELARAPAVFTVSETSRQDIHEHYGYPLERIFVVPNGVDRQVFRPALDDDAASVAAPSGGSCLAAAGNGSVVGAAARAERDPFLLVVGAGFRHKNVEELLFHAACWRDHYELVVVSCRGAQRQRLERAVGAAQLRGRVRFVEYATQPMLVRLYQRCAAFVYPSRWEGFGIPPLEALACGARVIVSDIPAHREVLGAHADYVRLGDPDSWVGAFTQLRAALSGADDKTAPALRGGAEGQSPLERYSWERSGALLVQHLLSLEPRLVRRSAEPALTRTPIPLTKGAEP